MDEQSTLKTVSLPYGPAPTGQVFSFTIALPRELDRPLSVSLGQAVVNPAIHNAKLKLTGPVLSELNERRHHEIQVLVVPEFHGGDTPAADESVMCDQIS